MKKVRKRENFLYNVQHTHVDVIKKRKILCTYMCVQKKLFFSMHLIHRYLRRVYARNTLHWEFQKQENCETTENNNSSVHVLWHCCCYYSMTVEVIINSHFQIHTNEWERVESTIQCWVYACVFDMIKRKRIKRKLKICIKIAILAACYICQNTEQRTHVAKWIGILYWDIHIQKKSSFFCIHCVCCEKNVWFYLNFILYWKSPGMSKGFFFS